MGRRYWFAGVAGLLMGCVVWGWVRTTHASDDLPSEYQFEWETSRTIQTHVPLLPPSESFKRAQSVLHEFDVKQDLLAVQRDLIKLDHLLCDEPLKIEQTKSRLKFLDPLNFGANFISFREGGATSYWDQTAKEQLLWRSPSACSAEKPTEVLRQFALTGLRIAIDPGHMGGDFWDRLSGKFVSDGSSKISEGVLNLQTALLLADELTKLGAEVMLTHEQLGPVYNTPLSQLEVSEWAKEELAFSQYDPWFQTLLNRGTAGSSSLLAAFRNSSEVRALFAESKRARYFISRADLEERSKRMLAFEPHLSIIIHYNTSGKSSLRGSSLSQAGYARTMAFVPGAITSKELSGIREIESLIWHAFAPKSYEASIALSGAIVGQISKNLGLPLAQNSTEESKKIAPGIFARNLVVSRRLHGQVQAFLEVLHYDDPVQFKKLLPRDHMLKVGDHVTYYSEYLIQIVNAIRDGVLAYQIQSTGQ